MPVSQQSGFVFPMIAKGKQGRVNYAHNDSQQLIEDSVAQILLTTPGERIGNPAFGCRIRMIHFEPTSPGYVTTIQNLIIEALKRWEPRVTVRPTDITVVYANDNSGKTQVTVSYKINNPDFTGKPTNTIVITL
jgi:phage baseplate assembly protein W